MTAKPSWGQLLLTLWLWGNVRLLPSNSPHLRDTLSPGGGRPFSWIVLAGEGTSFDLHLDTLFVSTDTTGSLSGSWYLVDKKPPASMVMESFMVSEIDRLTWRGK